MAQDSLVRIYFIYYPAAEPRRVGRFVSPTRRLVNRRIFLYKVKIRHRFYPLA